MAALLASKLGTFAGCGLASLASYGFDYSMFFVHALK